jgi:phosphatidylserine decarboxylase
MTVKPRLPIRLEQIRQARLIHGGLAQLCLAVVAIKLARVPIPSRRLRRRLFRDQYARRYPPGLNEEESEHPVDDYPSLNALFTRGLRPEHRPIPAASRAILSPCDGRVQDVGRVDGGKLLTVKGIEYSLVSLLADNDAEADARAYEGGLFAIIFLSPIDCHRVFSPVAGRLECVVHVPGSRLLVHPPLQRPEYPVYTRNERVVLHLAADAGPCAVVMVAGWGVGNITLPLAPGFRPGSKRVESFGWESPPAVERGDWIATFELGSTVVLLTSPSPGATSLVTPNEKVCYGQPLFRPAEHSHDD